jgi:hypothetical protein
MLQAQEGEAEVRSQALQVVFEMLALEQPKEIVELHLQQSLQQVLAHQESLHPLNDQHIRPLHH